MALSDLLNSVEKKVSEVKDLKVKADKATTDSVAVNNKLASAQKELEDLRNAVHESLGNVFNENPRIRVN